jgi:hypothetical protein
MRNGFLTALAASTATLTMAGSGDTGDGAIDWFGGY